MTLRSNKAQPLSQLFTLSGHGSSTHWFHCNCSRSSGGIKSAWFSYSISRSSAVSEHVVERAANEDVNLFPTRCHQYYSKVLLDPAPILKNGDEEILLLHLGHNQRGGAFVAFCIDIGAARKK